MYVLDVLEALVDHSPLTGEQVSAALCKSRSYISMVKRSRGKQGPLLSTVCDVADVCGCDVVLVDRATGERVGVVDPPRRTADAGVADSSQG